MDHRDYIYDQILVLRCREADVAALDELLIRWQERLWRHAMRLTGDYEASWDILQETMMAISRRISHLSDPAAFWAWAYRITTNQCRDYFRKKKRRERLIEALYQQPWPTGSVRKDEGTLDLRAALATLPGAQQALLTMRYEEGFSIDEIAHILGIPAGTVKSRLSTARQNLRSLIKEQEV